NLQAPLSKPEQGAGPPSGWAGGAAGSGRIEDVAADEHALEVRRRDLVAERGGVEVAELRDREQRRREGEADVRVRQLRAETVASRVDDLSMIERDRRQSVDRMPRGVAGKFGIEVARHEAEVSRCELPLARNALRFAQRLQLLEVRELADVHLRGQVAPDRLLERLV